MIRFATLRGPLTLAALLSISTAVAAPPAPAPADRAGWLADFDTLIQALERRSANLAWSASPASGVDVPALYRRARRHLAEARDAGEARDAIRQFVAGFRDGHMSALPWLAASPGHETPEPPAAGLDPSDPAAGCASLGLASTANGAFSLPFETLPGFRLIADGLAQPFRTGTLPLGEGRLLAVIRIAHFSAAAFPATCLEAWADMRAHGRAITAEAVREAAEHRWFADLAGRLQVLRSRGASALIVDIGNNSGGNDMGDWTARLFSAGPVRSAPLLVTASEEGRAYLDEQIAVIEDALKSAGDRPGEAAILTEALQAFRARRDAASRLTCDRSWVWHEQRAWDPSGCSGLVEAGYASGPLRALPAGPLTDTAAQALYWPVRVAPLAGAWTGSTFVLTDDRTYSSAEMFAATMRDNGLARIVGQRSGGDGCGFMASPTPLVLPHIRLRFRIPNCVRLRADGSDEVAGVQPDIEVAPTEGESARARALRLVMEIERAGPG